MRASHVAVFAVLVSSSVASAQNLEVHYINVGWGSSVLVKGPDGTTVLLEAGNTGDGTNQVVPYLQSIGILPANGLDYIIAGHQHCDHIGGLDEVIGAGYDVQIRNYYNGSNYASTCVDGWNAAAATTSAGAPVVPIVGEVLLLGNGAKLTFVAVDGNIIGGGSVSVSDENDRSIAVLVQYGGFDYLWASDLGGGDADFSCTGRSTSQADVESSVVQAISPGGAAPLISAGGVDVLNVNHHGSESSTNPNWVNYTVPALAVIATGAGQSSGWDLPRIDVVEHVLLAQSVSCVTAPPTFVLQTEEGAPTGPLTSFAGYSVGNIRITSDGIADFSVDADGQVNQGPNEVVAAGLPRVFALDDFTGPDTTPPTTAITSPGNGAILGGTLVVSASASDNVGVTSVEFFLDGVFQFSDAGPPYQWSWNTTTVADGSHALRSEALDAAGNRGVSTTVTVTVDNTSLDIAGWSIVQQNSAGTFDLPAGTRIQPNGYVIVARDATKAAFEAFWGVTLGSNVNYVNSAGAMPVINGSENYKLFNAGGGLEDGATISMAGSGLQSIRRIDPCLPPKKASSWNVGATSTATPGSGAGAGCGTGVVINEFSDASGTGNFIYEFVELHFDQ